MKSGVPFEIDYPEEGIKLTVPKVATGKTAGAFSKNVNYFIEELRKQKCFHPENNTANEKMENAGTNYNYLHYNFILVF